MTENLIGKWAEAIKQHEGYFKGSRSYRNNNPANARFVGQKGAIGRDDKGFAVFATYSDGMKYLQAMLLNAATGKSKIYKPTMTLYDFFAKYAPSSDGNKPRQYAESVAEQMGVSPNDQISSFV